MAGEAPSAKPRIDKLGVKPGLRVALLGIRDEAFVSELREQGARVSARRIKNANLIFLGCEKAGHLARIAQVKDDLARDGALWVVRPKGTKAITEAQTMEAGLASGLVDVKVVSFSQTHTAEKFVTRLKDR